MARTKAGGDRSGDPPQGQQDQPRPRTKPRDLRGWYELGQQTIQEFPGTSIYHPDTIRRLAAELGLTRDVIRKAVDFARQYNRRELEELCRLRPAGRPLTFAHVCRLLSVEDRDQREQLQRRAADEGWNQHELAVAIRQLRTTRSPSGRQLKKPRSLAAALLQITDQTEGWLRRYERAWNGDTLSGPDDGEVEDPQKLEDALNQAIEALGQLQKSAGKLKTRLRGIRDRRKS